MISLFLMIMRIFFLLLLFYVPALGESRLSEVKVRVTPSLVQALAERELKLGDPVYLRAFKDERILEVWMKRVEEEQYRLFQSYPIAGLSGELGPKLREGDFQAPEGFYEVRKGSLNPRSSYHLSFNIGYPNAYDRHHGRTGSFIMVHGSNVSAGCYAMTDPVVEVLYLLVEAALHKGQKAVAFHSFPYVMKKKWLAPQHEHWGSFWKQELAPAYFIFEKERRLPLISLEGGRYVVR